MLVLLALRPRHDASEPVPSAEPGAPTVVVWYGEEQTFGQAGDPQRWANLLGQAHAPGGLAALSYRLNGGPSIPLPWGVNANRLAAGGDYNVELDRERLVPHPGTNTVEITATGSSGVTTRRTVTVRHHARRLTPLPYTIDWSNLDGVDRVNEVASIVDGAWELTEAGLHTTKKGYDRLIALGDRNWSPEYEARARVILHDWRPYGGVGLAMGWQGHAGEADPRVDWPMEALGWVRNLPGQQEAQVMTFEGGVRERVSYDMPEGTTYELRVRSERLGGGLARFAFKIWPRGSSEPAWTVTRDVPERAGSLLLVAHHANVTWGPVTIVPLGGNSPPVFVSRPPAQVEVGRIYHYDVVAADPDLTDSLTMSPVKLPEFLSLEVQDDGQATLMGRPREADLGLHDVGLHVSDGSLSAEQAFSVEVIPATHREIHSDSFAAASWQPFWRLFQGEAGSGIELERGAALFVLGNGSAQPLTHEDLSAPRLLQEAPDEDFAVEVEFAADPIAGAQGQGIVVHDVHDRVLLVGNVRQAGRPRLVARLLDESGQQVFALRSPGRPSRAADPHRFRLERWGDTWRASSSAGGLWSDLATFSAALEVSEVGAFASQDDATEERITARLNHFLSLGDPRAADTFNRPPEFLTEPPGDAAPGRVYGYTVRAADPDGEAVRLEALVLPEWLRFEALRDGGQLGGTPAHDHRGAHTVALQASDSRGGRHLQIFDVLVSPGPVETVTADDFRGARLADSWRLQDPHGESLLKTDEGALDLSVPGGRTHDLWLDSHDAPRLVQSVNDADLSVRTSFEGPVEPRYRLVGLVLQNDQGSLVRCGPFHDGTRIRVLLAVLRNQRVEKVAAPAAQESVRHLRLTRVGNAVSCDYSADGLRWTRAAVLPHGSRFDAVGLFVGNAGGRAAEAAGARFRYFVGQGDVVPRYRSLR